MNNCSFHTCTINDVISKVLILIHVSSIDLIVMKDACNVYLPSWLRSSLINWFGIILECFDIRECLIMWSGHSLHFGTCSLYSVRFQLEYVEIHQWKSVIMRFSIHTSNFINMHEAQYKYKIWQVNELRCRWMRPHSFCLFPGTMATAMASLQPITFSARSLKTPLSQKSIPSADIKGPCAAGEFTSSSSISSHVLPPNHP